MYEIRECEEKDIKQLIELWVKICVEEYGYKKWEREIIQQGIKEYEKVLIATDRGKVIGSMAYKKINDETAELKRIYFYKEYRGKGLAKQLYNIIIEMLKEKNYKKLMVETCENFQRGINFYLKNNFKLVLKNENKQVYMLNIK